VTSQAQRSRTKLARLVRLYGPDYPAVRAARSELAAAHLIAAARRFREAGMTLQLLPRAERSRLDRYLTGTLLPWDRDGDSS
jgi:hypothetical protein